MRNPAFLIRIIIITRHPGPRNPVRVRRGGIVD